MHTHPNINFIGTECETLAHLLSQVLQTYCSRLNKFLRGATLASFANDLYEAHIITTELRDNPVYNTIETQFTEMLSIMGSKEEFEKYCKGFLSALRSLRGPVELLSEKLKDEWRNIASTKLQINLIL